MELITLNLEDIVPYENNPRNNEFAVEAVAESIRQVGYVTPIIIDEDNVVLAGHTRLMALEQLGHEEAECIRIVGLKEEQKRKFRILDNKTAELADWDIDLLKDELSVLDLGDFSWFDDIINPNLSASGNGSKKETGPAGENLDDGVIRCPKCGAVIEGDMGEEDGDHSDIY